MTRTSICCRAGVILNEIAETFEKLDLYHLDHNEVSVAKSDKRNFNGLECNDHSTNGCHESVFSTSILCFVLAKCHTMSSHSATSQWPCQDCQDVKNLSRRWQPGWEQFGVNASDTAITSILATSRCTVVRMQSIQTDA
jgi:hypothetical protein